MPSSAASARLIVIGPSSIDIGLAKPDDADELARLFESQAVGCHCQFWHFNGTSQGWLERCFQTPGVNEAAMRHALSQGLPSMHGLVARSPSNAVLGWLKVAPAAALSKIYDQRLYRGLPCLDRPPSGAFTLGCLLVHEDHRRRGLARQMLQVAIREAPGWGAHCLEAFPRAEDHVSDQALMMGPHQLLLQMGFKVVHDFSPYPVLRLDLEAAPSSPAAGYESSGSQSS